MRIGIVGSGNMGRAIGAGLSKSGHDVLFGSRRHGQALDAAAFAERARAGTNDEAAAFGEVLVWTMREADPAAVLDEPSLLDGSILIDINNRDYATEARTGGWFGEAFAERLQAAAPGARVVKAFNTIAVETFWMAPETLLATGAQTFLAGTDANAKVVVADLARELGFNAVDVGGGPAAYRAVEALGDVIRLLMIDGGLGPTAHLGLTALPAPPPGSARERTRSNYS